MNFLRRYRFLWISLGLIAVITSVISHGYYQYPLGSMMDMQILMGVRFLVFGLMKLPNLSGFVEMFSQYDLVSSRFSRYGYVFPFIEIACGSMYLRDSDMQYSLPLNSVVIVFTALTSLGILIALFHPRKFECACMGSAFAVPLGRPSLIEQLSMTIMAAWMIVIMM